MSILLNAEALTQIPLLAALAEREREELLPCLEVRTVKYGKCVVRADEPGQFIMFVLEGSVKVTLSGAEGRSLVIDILGRGQFFGELALLTGEPRSADVEAAEDSVLLVLSQRDFDEHVKQSSGLQRALLRELAYRLKRTTERARDLALFDVYRRLARVLYSLSQPDAGAEGTRVVARRPTHRELAELTGTSREMVSRALKELELAGHVKGEGRRLVILSLPN